MIAKSRFRDFYKGLNGPERTKTLQIMDKLIIENREYADKKNYGYLCNLLSCLALSMMLEEKGRNREESERIIIGAMHEFVSSSIPSMQRMTKHRLFVPFLKRFMPLKVSRICCYVWEIELPKIRKGQFAMTTHRCIFFGIFSKYGRSELTLGFCQVDNILYGKLPKTRFSYTERIGEGGKRCDYLFEREA